MPLRARLDHAHAHNKHSEQQPMSMAPANLNNAPEYRLNLREMHSALKNEFSRNAAICGGPTPQSLNTVNLRLDEVSHIRAALSKADLYSRTIADKMRDEIERGKVSAEILTNDLLQFAAISH
jgi:hypothetical protein